MHRNYLYNRLWNEIKFLADKKKYSTYVCIKLQDNKNILKICELVHYKSRESTFI